MQCAVVVHCSALHFKPFGLVVVRTRGYVPLYIRSPYLQVAAMYMGHSMMERRHNGVFRSITRSVCVLVTFVAWHVSEPCVEASTARPFHPRAFVSCSNTVPSVSCLSFPFLNIGNREVYSKLHKRQMGQYLNRSQPLYAGDLTRLQQLNKVCTDTKPKLQACDWNPQADPLLEIRGLKAKASEDGTLILNGVDLVVKQGETHAIMGRNGSGKLITINHQFNEASKKLRLGP